MKRKLCQAGILEIEKISIILETQFSWVKFRVKNKGTRRRATALEFESGGRLVHFRCFIVVVVIIIILFGHDKWNREWKIKNNNNNVAPVG